MNLKRSGFAKGCQLLGCMGLLVAVMVVPGQWVSGSIRFEAKAGTIVSVVFVLLAVYLSKSLKPFLVVSAELLLFGGATYFFVVLSVAIETGWYHWILIGALGLASSGLAFIGAYALRRMNRVVVQLAVQPEGPSSRPSV